MSKKGFTLIELVAAMLIAGIACTIAMSVLERAWFQRSAAEAEELEVHDVPLIQAYVGKYALRDSVPCVVVADSVKAKMPTVIEMNTTCRQGAYGLRVSWNAVLQVRGKKMSVRGVR